MPDHSSPSVEMEESDGPSDSSGVPGVSASTPLVGVRDAPSSVPLSAEAVASKETRSPKGRASGSSVNRQQKNGQSREDSKKVKTKLKPITPPNKPFK